MEAETPIIDQEVLSRQLAAYGFETQQKIMTLKIFIHGISGLGIEVTKNLILINPQSVTLYDPRKVSFEDIGRNFYCRPQHIGVMSRAEASLSQLKQLNPVVSVKIAETDSIEYISSNFDCVVVLDNYDKDYLIKLNKAMRRKKGGFVYGGCLGLYGFVFVDFGENHLILDRTGQQPKKSFVANIQQSEKGLVYMYQDQRHNLNDGDVVTFKNVKGMTEINGKRFQIKVRTPYSIQTGDTRNFGKYMDGGVVSQVKQPFHVKFNDFQTSLEKWHASSHQQLYVTSQDKAEIHEQLHVILNTILSYYAKHQRLPRPLNSQDAEQLKLLVRQQLLNIANRQDNNFSVTKIDQKLINNVAIFAGTQISPCNSFWGGIISQQVVKITGKYTPITQWHHHQFFEAFSDQGLEHTVVEDRYYDYRILFGDQFLHKVFKSNVFLVGVGALGCEYLKMLALMGFSSQKGRIVIADDDKICAHNLNRQFLFNKKHVGAHKVQIATKQTKKINNTTFIEGHALIIDSQSQNVFDDEFWKSLDFILSGVDNTRTRFYLDNQCILYQKPLFDAGTNGTKCHTQAILPHLTCSYNDITDSYENMVPLKSMNSFPYKIEQCMHKARDYFQGMFQEPSQNLQNFLKNKQNFFILIKKQHSYNLPLLEQKLREVTNLLNIKHNQKYQDCVEMAVSFFQKTFNHKIHQILQFFPSNHIVQETGIPFWRGRKCAPKPIELDLNDPLHLQLVTAAAKILADIVKLPKQNQKSVAQLAAKVKIAPYQPIKKIVKVPATQTTTVGNGDNNIKINDLSATLDLAESAVKKNIQLLEQQLRKITINNEGETSLVQFEKDDPTNFHIDFVAAVANLIAQNYSIDEKITKFQFKVKAGRIIPAIIPTTTMAAGAVGIEIIKYMLNKKIDRYKNMTSNLALPFIIFNTPSKPILHTDKQYDPIMCGPVKVVPENFTKWQKIHIKGPMTVQSLKKYFQNTYQIEVQMISYGHHFIYSSFLKKTEYRVALLVNVAVQDAVKRQLPKNKKILCLGIAATTAGVDCLLPQICYEI